MTWTKRIAPPAKRIPELVQAFVFVVLFVTIEIAAIANAGSENKIPKYGTIENTTSANAYVSAGDSLSRR